LGGAFTVDGFLEESLQNTLMGFFNGFNQFLEDARKDCPESESILSKMCRSGGDRSKTYEEKGKALIKGTRGLASLAERFLGEILTMVGDEGTKEELVSLGEFKGRVEYFLNEVQFLYGELAAKNGQSWITIIRKITRSDALPSKSRK
jgi:hypothetical protein